MATVSSLQACTYCHQVLNEEDKKSRVCSGCGTTLQHIAPKIPETRFRVPVPLTWQLQAELARIKKLNIPINEREEEEKKAKQEFVQLVKALSESHRASYMDDVLYYVRNILAIKDGDIASRITFYAEKIHEVTKAAQAFKKAISNTTEGG